MLFYFPLYLDLAFPPLLFDNEIFTISDFIIDQSNKYVRVCVCVWVWMCVGVDVCGWLGTGVLMVYVLIWTIVMVVFKRQCNSRGLV